MILGLGASVYGRRPIPNDLEPPVDACNNTESFTNAHAGLRPRPHVGAVGDRLPGDAGGTMPATLEALTDRYLDMMVEDNPVFATFLGLHSRDAELGDFSAEAFGERADHARALLADLESVPLEDVPVDDYVDARALRISLGRSVFVHERLRPHRIEPSTYVGAALSGCHLLIIKDFAPLEDRARSLLERVRAVPEVLASCRRNIEDPPGIFARIGADRARGGAAFLRSVIPEVADRVPLVASELRSAASAAADAFDEIAEHLSCLEDACTTPFAIGRENYEWLLREAHLLDFDSDELLEMGRGAIRSTREAMDAAAREIDSGRGWREIVEALKGEHPPADGLRQRYASEMKRARRFVIERDLVTVPDEESLDVVDTPVFARAVLPYAAYMPAGPFDARQQGFFWVTPVDSNLPSEDRERQLRGHGVHSIPVIALHEGYPGHHLQLVRANANPRKARKLTWNNVFIEGWALYCEEMMKDAGFLDDPRSRLFQLKDTLWRAARIVVDVGLQRGEMSIDQAIDFMVDEAALERVNATAEVKRYTANPTQPSSYLIGKGQIVGIRRRYEEARGRGFDLKVFHDALLDVGSVPPKLAALALGLEGEEPA